MSADLMSSKNTEQVSAQPVWACNGGLAILRGYSWAVLRLLAMWWGFQAHVWGACRRRNYEMTALVYHIVKMVSLVKNC